MDIRAVRRVGTDAHIVGTAHAGRKHGTRHARTHARTRSIAMADVASSRGYSRHLRQTGVSSDDTPRRPHAYGPFLSFPGHCNAGTTWVKQSLKHCSNFGFDGNKYSSLSAAQAACSTNSQCSGVYDSRCDNSGSFYQCDSTSLQTSSTSCVYTKSGTGTGESPSHCAHTNHHVARLCEYLTGPHLCNHADWCSGSGSGGGTHARTRTHAHTQARTQE